VALPGLAERLALQTLVQASAAPAAFAKMAAKVTSLVSLTPEGDLITETGGQADRVPGLTSIFRAPSSGGLGVRLGLISSV
jgi:hypothetical protein